MIVPVAFNYVHQALNPTRWPLEFHALLAYIVHRVYDAIKALTPRFLGTGTNVPNGYGQVKWFCFSLSELSCRNITWHYIGHSLPR